MKWKIEYDNDTGARDDYFSQWWNVTDGEKRFTCDSEEEAKWLCDKLNSGEQQPVTGELYWKQRCFAAEMYINELPYKGTNNFRKWQQLKNQEVEPQQNQRTVEGL